MDKPFEISSVIKGSPVQLIHGHHYANADSNLPKRQITVHITKNVPTEDKMPKTIIVVGVARGGTTVVAAVLDSIGVYMGPSTQLGAGGAFENQVFMTDETNWPAEIDRCNLLYDIWGWKNPSMFNMMDHIPHTVRNPHCIFVFRDIIALAGGLIARRGINQDSGDVVALAEESLQTLYKAATEIDLPSLFVSYERIKTSPEVFVASLAQFCGLTVSPRQRAEAMERIMPQGGYIHLPNGWRSATDQSTE